MAHIQSDLDDLEALGLVKRWMKTPNEMAVRWMRLTDEVRIRQRGSVILFQVRLPDGALVKFKTRRANRLTGFSRG